MLPIPEYQLRKHDWDTLFDGQIRAVHLLSIDNDIEGFRNLARKVARERDLMLYTARFRNLVIVQAKVKET